ncbi:MAG: DUF4199 domain-containing protein [Bacteroidales bacterium]|nr:DUF4199 domain-containing protein [Bacteroidales bacterium]
MSENENKTVWAEAGRSGLVLGGISIAYFLLTLVVPKLGTGFLVSMLSFLLWGLKVFLCIYMMHRFLKIEAAENGGERRRTFRYGMATALCSALLYAGFCLAWTTFVQPDFYEAAFEAALQMYTSFNIPAETLDMMSNMESSMPTLTFFTNLIWCWIFGTVLAAIISSSICKQDDPFAEK